MNRIDVVLADDHALLREGLRVLIGAQPDLAVVAEAGTGPDAVERVREFQPRVLCLDLSMPGWGLVPTIERARECSPRTKILVVTSHDDPAYARAALAAGANGYVLKSAASAELVAAIRTVAAGGTVLGASLQDAVGEPTATNRELSPRERELLALLAQGLTHQVIADRLFLSVKTVETYRARLKAKTGLKSRADFVRYGLETGLLLPSDADAPRPAE